MITAAETAKWGASLDAWRLGRRAMNATGPEAEALWDRMLAEFEAIASTPVDPGNDEGPFWAVARAMDAGRVRKALEIVAQMAETPGWTYRLNGSRAALAGRLAVLGHLDEATDWTTKLDPLDDFVIHWRSILWGAVIGARRVWKPGHGASGLPDGLDLHQVFLQMERIEGPPPTDTERAEWRQLVARVSTNRDLLHEWIDDWGGDVDESP